MDTIVPDADLTARLNGLDKQLVFCDSRGHLLGYYLPVDRYKKLVLSQLEVPLSQQEIERLRSEQGGSSLHEFWDRTHQQRNS